MFRLRRAVVVVFYYEKNITMAHLSIHLQFIQYNYILTAFIG